MDLLVIGMNSFAAQRLDALNLNVPDFPNHAVLRSKMAYGNRLLFSRDHRFVQLPESDSLAHSGWSWGATSLDFDHDGDLDVFIVNGHKSGRSAKDYEGQFWRNDIYLATSRHEPALDAYFQSVAARRYGAGESHGGYEKNRFYLNRGGGGFLEIGHLMQVASELDSRNAVSDDLDGDGQIDLLMATMEEWPRPRQALHLYRNVRPTNEGNWIGFRLRETKPGYSPVGATVRLRLPSGDQIRHLVTGDSYRSQHAPTALFGLGKKPGVPEAQIQWPNGAKQLLANPAINRYHDVRPEAAGRSSAEP